MKVLVTGSSGHLGEAIVRLLQQREIDYVSVDIKPSEYTTLVGNISDRSLVAKAMTGVTHVLHAATLHKPHVATHSRQDFVDTNITGTLNLLEEAVLHQVKAFIFTSTTSTFGDSMKPKAGEPAVWVTEETPSIPKNIYGVTKNAAEELCWLFYRNQGLPCLVLKTSRFFPEEDDSRELRDGFDEENLKAIEFLYRRVDMADAAEAHFLAMDKAPGIGFARYIISAPSPFQPEDLPLLHQDAPAVVRKYFPDFEAVFAQKGWKMQQKLGRVYASDKAQKELNWKPEYDFAHLLQCLREGKDYRSELWQAIGKKRYHNQQFNEGPYPVDE